ncbi:MAG: hypothetical protein K8T25_02265 [Planctomycetia bacterium]|nr:hypothetical protein [Planctomycetia bacterium]
MLTTSTDVADAKFDATDFAAAARGVAPAPEVAAPAESAAPVASASRDIADELATIDRLMKFLMPAVEAGKISAIREMRQLVLAKLKIAEFCDRRKRLDAKDAAAADQAARSARPWDYMHELVPPPSGIVHPPSSRVPGATAQRSARRASGAMPRRQRKPRRAHSRVPGATPQPFDPSSASAMQQIFAALAGAMPQAPGPLACAIPEAPGPVTMFPPPSPAYLQSTGISQEIFIRALRLLRDKLRERAASEDAKAAETNTPIDANTTTIITPAPGEYTATSLSSSDPEPRPP